MKLWQGLLFHHGYIADPTLARSLADAAEVTETAVTNAAPATPQPCGRVPPLVRLAHSFLLLGGRPMHAGRNFDVEEPLEPPPVPPCPGSAGAEVRSHA